MLDPAWSRAKALKLLEEVEKRPVLWDGKNPSFYGYASKEPAWEEVSAAVGFGKEECRRKMESLKGSYRRERRRILTAKNGGKDVTLCSMNLFIDFELILCSVDRNLQVEVVCLRRHQVP